MRKYHFSLWFNSLCLFIVIALLVYTKYINLSAGALFTPPHFSDSPTEGLLTNIFQLLCAIPPIICGFSFAILRKIHPHNQNNNFIFYSTLITFGFLINEKFRIHIILLTEFAIPKFITILLYAFIGLFYGIRFKAEIIKSTPYILLMIGLGLLISGVLVDLLHLGSSSSTPLEGIPKLFSGINVVIYYWLVCYKEVINLYTLRDIPR